MVTTFAQLFQAVKDVDAAGTLSTEWIEDQPGVMVDEHGTVLGQHLEAGGVGELFNVTMAEAGSTLRYNVAVLAVGNFNLTTGEQQVIHRCKNVLVLVSKPEATSCLDSAIKFVQDETPFVFHKTPAFCL